MLRFVAGILPVVSLAMMMAAPVAPRDRAWVDGRIAAWQPTGAERAWERIGWATGIRPAERLAKAHDRPVFVFTHDGHLGVGRC
jgi:hypothetical protein